MKKGIRTTSLAIVLLAVSLIAGVETFVYRQMRDRIALISANENERILNSLLAGLRDHEDFGSAIESGAELSARVLGVGVYRKDGSSLYAWGDAPDRFDASKVDPFATDNPERFVIPDKQSESLRFVIRSSQMSPPPPHGKPREGDASNGSGEPQAGRSDSNRHPFFFDVLVRSEWLYLDIRHEDYWRELTLMNILFPLVGLLILAFAFYVRRLWVRNDEYRERIERQKNLVTLGTAASTLAHEIKNPLLAIRLQTGILRKLCPDVGADELGIIDAEIERLSALTYRVNDYLREPRGNPEPLDVAAFAREVSATLVGRDLVTASTVPTVGFVALVDRERLRSILENLIRNALESGGAPAEIAIALGRKTGFIHIDVLDRGLGLSAQDARRLFEPFFTTKSRGTGIGLAICRRFAEASGGGVELLARDGGGCVARVTLPECGGTNESLDR